MVLLQVRVIVVKSKQDRIVIMIFRACLGEIPCLLILY